MHSQQQMNTFNSRIKRIQDPRYTHNIDPETGIKIPRHLGRDEIGKKPMPPLALLMMAGILGALCLLVARYLRMEVINVAPYFPDGLIAEMAMASMAAVVIGGFLRMQSFWTFGAQVMGALLCAVTMHNAVWVAPEVFASVFSQGYVDQILSITDPMSLHVNGATFVLPI